MSEDYLDIAWIHGEQKAILHGRRADGSEVERELTEAEREQVFAMELKYSRARDRLLRELAA
jgi:hypothetical protein